MNEIRQITISKEYFAHAFRDYVDPVWAWSREIFQNCVDAPGCTKIEAHFYSKPTGSVLEVENNGSPMSKDTLFNVLLALGGSNKGGADMVGGSNKGGADMVGGFGKAKEILYFAQESFSIHTGDIAVVGVGGSYTSSEGESTLKGTKSVVVTKWDISAVVAAFKKVVALSGWTGTVTLKVDDQQPETLTERLHRGFLRNRWDWGRIYTNRADSHRLVVRIGGVPMFSQYCAYAKGTVVVELDGESVNLLTANRDGMRYPYSSDLSTFITKLAIDKKSALRSIRWETTAHGSGTFYCSQQARATMHTALAQVFASATEKTELPEEIPGHAPHAIPGTATEITIGATQNIAVNHEFIIKNGLKNTDSWRMFTIPAKFLPYENFSEYSSRLTKIWVKVLFTLFKIDNRQGRFKVGFIFDEEVEAEHQEKDGVHTFLLNPAETVREEGKPVRLVHRFKARQDYAKVLSLAAHEYCHTKFDTHDEDFAGELTRVMALVMDNFSEFRGCFKL